MSQRGIWFYLSVAILQVLHNPTTSSKIRQVTVAFFSSMAFAIWRLIFCQCVCFCLCLSHFRADPDHFGAETSLKSAAFYLNPRLALPFPPCLNEKLPSKSGPHVRFTPGTYFKTEQYLPRAFSLNIFLSSREIVQTSKRKYRHGEKNTYIYLLQPLEAATRPSKRIVRRALMPASPEARMRLRPSFRSRRKAHFAWKIRFDRSWSLDVPFFDQKLEFHCRPNWFTKSGSSITKKPLGGSKSKSSQ